MRVLTGKHTVQTLTAPWWYTIVMVQTEDHAHHLQSHHHARNHPESSMNSIMTLHGIIISHYITSYIELNNWTLNNRSETSSTINRYHHRADNWSVSMIVHITIMLVVIEVLMMNMWMVQIAIMMMLVHIPGYGVVMLFWWWYASIISYGKMGCCNCRLDEAWLPLAVTVILIIAIRTHWRVNMHESIDFHLYYLLAINTRFTIFLSHYSYRWWTSSDFIGTFKSLALWIHLPIL